MSVMCLFSGYCIANFTDTSKFGRTPPISDEV